jgi:protein-S-isoprenylcysteine O-methyltransferase Ste14
MAKETTVTIRTTPAAVKPDNAAVKIYPGVVFAFCLAGGFAADWWLTPEIAHLPQPASLYAGLLLMLAGGVFAGLGIGRFVNLGVNPIPTKPAARMVGGGVYRFTRNPMYVGLVVTLAGIGIAAGSLPVLASAFPLFLFLDLYAIRREERYLKRTFGDEYLAYCQKVRRWL